MKNIILLLALLFSCTLSSCAPVASGAQGDAALEQERLEMEAIIFQERMRNNFRF